MTIKRRIIAVVAFCLLAAIAAVGSVYPAETIIGILIGGSAAGVIAAIVVRAVNAGANW